jgi:hypothetical protein
MGRGVGIASGIVAGGLLGAAARPAVVYVFWLRGAGGDLSAVLLAISAGIGLVVGVVAVLIAALVPGPRARPLLGALVGAALAYLVTTLTFLPLFWGGLLGLGGVRAVDAEAPLYGIAMALTGAVSGGCGPLLQGWLGRRRPARSVES